MARVFLGLGANLGDARATLCRALAMLAEHGRLGAISSLYDTAPVGYTEQPRFLNLACELETDLSPEELLRLVKRIEVALGRQTTVRWGPRYIDIDILLYDDLLVRTCNLTIPHPRLAERAFVLAPLAEIAAEVVVPGSGRTVAALQREVPDQDVRRLEERIEPCTE